MIDTHSHLYDDAFKDDVDEVIARCKQLKVSKIISPAIEPQSYDAMHDLCASYKGFMFPTMGLHPTSVNSNWESDLSIAKKFLYENPDRYVAIGEIGMDLYWSDEFILEHVKS